MNRNLVFFSMVIAILTNFSAPLNAQTFKVVDNKLFDPEGKEFIIRGVNNPHAWHEQRAMKSLEVFKESKINCVRVVWETKKKPNELTTVIEKCLENKIIPMIELHDVTGDTTTEGLMRMAAYYADSKTVRELLPFDDKILINVANEWGNHHTTAEYWKDAYLPVIAEIRKAGYKAPVVIDAPGWGQNHEAILLYAQELIAADPLHNILFSVHMYYSWNDAVKVERELQRMSDEKIPLIVGEFGYNFDKGYNNLKCEVDHVTVMRKCHELGIGYLAWSWSGNNKENAWLDMAEKSNWETLTWWGRQIMNSEYGITKNAKRASMFPEETDEEKVERLMKEAKAAAKKLKTDKRDQKLVEQNTKRRELAKKRAEKSKAKAEEIKAKHILKKKEKLEKQAEREQGKAVQEQPDNNKTE